MAIQQISTFLQSKPGHLARILALFESAHISVRGYALADTGDYGIGRFIVDDVAAALSVLEREGVAHAETDVLCLLLEDTPGELARVMQVLADCNINVQYSYSLISTYIVIKCEDMEAAQAALCAMPVKVIDHADL